MINSLKLYIDNNSLSESEDEFYDDARSMSRHSVYSESNFNFNEYNKFIGKLNKNKIADDFIASFDSCATNIITNLFKQHVDDDTLVLTSDSEHDSVVENYSKCKNHEFIIKKLSLDYSVLQKCKNYKKIFVYVIGTYCGSGHVVSDGIMGTVKQYLVSNNIEHTFILDAVQELFLLPRDYSIYDYVIGTAHAIIPRFNMGILLSKKNKPYNRLYPDQKMLSTFITLFDMIPDTSMFSTLMKMNFWYLRDTNIQINSGVPHLFSIGNAEGTLLPLISEEDRLYKQTRGFYSVHFRGTWFKFGTDKFKTIIDRTEKFLEVNGYKR